jgi:hypothetical protein
MTLTRDGNTVTLQMTNEDFVSLLLALGYASGAAHRAGDLTRFWGWIDFANRLNRTNPDFRVYDIPEEFRP